MIRMEKDHQIEASEPSRPLDECKNEPGPSKGVCLTKLADLPEKALLDETALAEALQVTKRTVRRMVARYELPPPLRLSGRSRFFAGKVLAYLEAQADRLEHTAKKEAEKFRALS